MNSLFFTEKFKDIDLSREEDWIKRDLKGLYQVSNRGRIKNVRTGRFVNRYKDSKGYLAVSLLGYSGKSYKSEVHFLVAYAFLKNTNPEIYTVINHKDENKMNADVRNLEWCTYKYNSRYSMYKKCKLSDFEIAEIDKYCSIFPILGKTDKAAYREIGLPTNVKELAEKYNISTSVVYDIKNRRGYYGYVLAENFKTNGTRIDGFDDFYEKLPGADYLDEKVPYMEI